MYQAVGYRVGLALTTAFLGRVSARTGRTAEAREFLKEARADFVAIEGGFEVRQVDTFIAESMVLVGDAVRAVDLVEGTIAGARSGDELGILGPPLYRCLGYARAQLGDHVAARAAFEESLSLGRDQAQSYEVGLTLLALSRIADGDSDTATLGAEASEILEGLGVVEVPAVAVSAPLVLEPEPGLDAAMLGHIDG